LRVDVDYRDPLLLLYALIDFICSVLSHTWRTYVLKTFGIALAMAAGLASVTPALALQTTVTQVDKDADGSMTCHFVVKLDPGEILTPGTTKKTGDFVTIYNFYGLVDGSAKGL